MMNEYVLALLKCKGIGNTTVLKYIRNNNFDFNKIKTNITQIISKEEIVNFDTKLLLATEEIGINKAKGIEIITILDNDFPTKLYTISDPVIYLYYKGNVSILKKEAVAIIGTRKPSDATKKTTEDISYKLASLGIVIVSGLAIGVDTIAHQGCLDAGGKTIAVLPSSLDNIQPKVNEKLAEQIIIKGGCLLTEYSVGTVVNKYNYAKRDRIQSALSDVILVTEAEEKSGTMITVREHFKEKKIVYQHFTNKNKIIENKLDFYNKKDIEKIIETMKLSSGKEKTRGSVVCEEQITLF